MPKHRRVCSLDYCDEPHYGRGYCRAHLWQLNHGVALRPVRKLQRGRLCDIPGCGGKHKARGLCQTHLSRQAAGAPLDTPIRGRGTPQPPPPAVEVPPSSSFPAGWDRHMAVRKPRQVVDKTFYELPVVAPTDPRTLAVVADRLRRWGADDLAEMLGVAPDQVRVEAERWLMWEGTAA